MATDFTVKLKKIFIILSIFALYGGLSLYASTFDSTLKKANILGRAGKFIAEIDTLLKMRNLNTMTLDEYAEITEDDIWGYNNLSLKKFFRENVIKTYKEKKR